MEVESGLIALCSTLQAKGSRVTWGGSAPAHPDVAWARIHLFATKFEYGSSFHIFLGALQGGSDLRAAERNAFAKDPAILEKEVAANLTAGQWQAVSVPGRPLDPKRDLGEHSVDAAVVGVYLADARLTVDPKGAEAAYKTAIEAGGTTRLLGLEAMANLVERKKQDATPFREAAMKAGSRSAPIYVATALEEGTPPEQAVTLLKKAADLNPRWSDPLLEAGRLTRDPAEKEALLKKATQVNRRCTECWITLAEAQTESGHASAAQGSWLRAEDSAPDAAERDRIHQTRIDSEQARLDAAEAATRRERESVHLADQRAQQSQEERIRAAERKANAALDGAAGGSKPENVVPWQDTIPKRTLSGILRKVECIGANARLTVAAKSGPEAILLLLHPAASNVACDTSQTNKQVSITYAAQEDERFKTTGTVVSIQFR
jgi:hypothetical protein